MPTSPQNLNVPEGRYSVFSAEDAEGRTIPCLLCSEVIEDGDPIYVDPSLGKDGEEEVIVTSYWHSECWDAAEETLDALEMKTVKYHDAHM
jgi:hypothetical protein